MSLSRTTSLAVSTALITLAAALSACGSSSASPAPAATTGAGAGGSGAGGSGAGASAGSSAGGSGNLGAVGPCFSTNPICGLPGSSCMALVDNTTVTRKTLRMSQLAVTKPATLASKTVEFSIITPAVTWIDNPACGLTAPGKAGQFNWLLEIDTANKTMKTGGAAPVADAHGGYCYVNQSFGGLLVAPTTGPIDLKDNGDGTFDFSSMGKFDISVPIFLDATGTKAPIVLPLKGGTITNGKLSEKGNCIGRFRGKAGELDPTTKPPCATQSSDPKDPLSYSYVNDATLTGYITAEDADKVLVVDLGESLCGLLTNAIMTAADGTKVCKRDMAGKLDFSSSMTGPDFSSKGDGVKDSFELGATFAAAAVKINDTCPLDRLRPKRRSVVRAGGALFTERRAPA